MVASILESLALGVVLVAGVVCMAALAGGFLLWRSVRRRLRALRTHGAVIGATAVWEAAASSRWNRSGATATPDDVAAWSSTRVRKELWRSVDRAGAAVRAADSVGAPTAQRRQLGRRCAVGSRRRPPTSTRCCASTRRHGCPSPCATRWSR